MSIHARTLGTLLRHLIDLLDGAVQRRYTEAGLDYRPRYTPVVRVLAAVESASIKAIADRAGLTHSAASQTVAQMVKAGLAEAVPGKDARERVVSLTAQGLAILPMLEQLWAATNAAADALDNELTRPLTDALEEAIDALDQQPFGERITQQISRTPRSQPSDHGANDAS